MSDLAIRAVNIADMDHLLPLLADYQRFYRSEALDAATNRRFFSRFIDDSSQGIQHLAVRSAEAVGFSTLYFSYCSIEAAPVATLYDLYVVPEQRGRGIGRALIENAAEVARERDMYQMVWFTAPSNHTAQALYDRVDAERSEWVQYTLQLGERS